MTTFETYTVAVDGLTLSRMVWRRFKRPMFGMVERILDLNRNLSEKPAVLPIGTVVVIPIDPPPTKSARVKTQTVIQLWD